MELRCDQDDKGCIHFIPDYNIGFKIVTPKQGDQYNGQKYENHSLVFLLGGTVKFSYNDFINRHFTEGDLFFIPQAAEMFGIALSDARMLVLTFNNRVESLCDRCRLSQSKHYMSEIDYDFRPLRMTKTLLNFADLMDQYISKEIKCSFLHELKQKELFVVMGVEFTEKELVELFYPILGGNIDFKIKVLENYRYGQDVNELVEMFGMSYSAFLRRFKKEFGEPIQSWMLKQKAKRIKTRLSIYSITISDIVKDFDFTDTSHFVRFCHKYYGCTPTELIKSIRYKDSD